MIEIWADGICEPNPGHACWAWIARREGMVIASDHGYLGNGKTNNDAEYVAVGKALRWLQDNYPSESAILYSDSQLAVKQIAGEWACNKERLRAYRDRVIQILKSLVSVEIKWISSKHNGDADNLTRIAYRNAVGKGPPVRH